MNPDLKQLQPYPFEKLARLKQGITPPAHLSHIALSIGEPKHAAPDFVAQALINELHHLSTYPSTAGLPQLRQAMAAWATRRFQLTPGTLTADQHILPVGGTREALFSFVQAVIDRNRSPLVLVPNPFYQIYEGAALLAGAEPYFLACDPGNRYLPDFEAVPEEIWQRCQLLFICSPGNPTGAVIPRETLTRLIELADRYDFVIASDECYSEIYPDEQNPPPGLLQVCAELGREDYARCVVFHSLSKRSNLPGLRSGFVAGDARILGQFLKYRTYHGCALPIQVQIASIAAWEDETHVMENRNLYRAKFEAVLPLLKPVLEVSAPDAGFYLWPRTPMADDLFARELFATQNVTVLPGQFLSREVKGHHPGNGHCRLALVAPLEECIEAAERIRSFIKER